MKYGVLKNTLFDKYRLVSICASFFLLFALVPSSISHPTIVFGDGLFMEELSASFGDRKGDLIIKMNPPVVTNETLKGHKCWCRRTDIRGYAAWSFSGYQWRRL
jgi:hypothetical protein